MSARELERVEVMGRVAKEELKLMDAAAMLQLSYRQVKRLWRRYRQKGSQGLQHGNVGRVSNRSKPAKFRRRVLSLIRQKYSGSEEERFGPTLAAEHLGEEDGIAIDHETLRGWMLAEGPKDCGVVNGSGRNTANEESARLTLANWYSWTGVFTTGWKGVVRGVA